MEFGLLDFNTLRNISLYFPSQKDDNNLTNKKIYLFETIKSI